MLHDITKLSADRIFDLGLARGFQDPALFFQMTVLDNMMLPAKQQQGEHPWYAPWRRFWKHQENENARKSGEILEQLKGILNGEEEE